MPTDFVHHLTIFTVGFVASAINAFAFGGSLVSFPTLIWLGLPPIVANATNTAAVWPGSLGAVWGYRRELRDTSPQVYWLIAPSIAGAITGAVLLRITPPDLFDRLVPLLILFATLLFAVQDRVQRMLNLAPEHHGSMWFTAAVVFQFFVSVYGGYFGAGMGILMLAALSVPRKLAAIEKEAPGADVPAELEDLLDRGLVFHEGERYLSLLVAPPRPFAIALPTTDFAVAVA